MMRKSTGALLLGAALLAGGCKGQTKEAAPAATASPAANWAAPAGVKTNEETD